MITLILGGARSGKSALAEKLIAAAATGGAIGTSDAAGTSDTGRAAGGIVTYIATMQVGDDDSLAERVAAHRARRPSGWHTVEAGADLPAVLRDLSGPVLLDSLGSWLANHSDFRANTAGLCDALQARAGDTVIVSDEVGLGVVPSTAIGGQFRDALGALNQAVAAVADRVLLVVAGRVLPLLEAPVH